MSKFFKFVYEHINKYAKLTTGKSIETFLDSMKFDYRSGEDIEITTDFLDQYNKEIDEAWAEIDAGNYLTQDKVEKFFAERRREPNGD